MTPDRHMSKCNYPPRERGVSRISPFRPLVSRQGRTGGFRRQQLHRRIAVHARRGFTLIELTISLAIMSILIVAMGSAMMLASQALPDKDDPGQDVIDAGRAADRFAADMKTAVHMTERGANAVTFTVADRNGDGIPERIRYAWSGTAGDPVTRKYNNGIATAVLDNARQFDLTYDLNTVVEQYPGTMVESAETKLMSFAGTEGLSTSHVHNDVWSAQYFKPTDLFPAGTTSWSVTRVKFKAQRDHDGPGITTIGLQLPTADNRPSGTVVDSATMDQLDLDAENFQWEEKSFSNATGLSPDTGLCITFTTSAPTSCELRYKGSGVALPNAAYITGTNLEWNAPATDKALLFYAYGKFVKSSVGTRNASRQYVTAVHAIVRSGESSSSRVETTIETLNTPEALSAVWELDFNGDPRQVDLNGDGGDWIDFEVPFDPAMLSTGIWYAPNAVYPNRVMLQTSPGEDFTELTTVDFRGRATSVGGWGAGVWINADRKSHPQCAPLFAKLFKPDASTHQLWIGYTPQDGGIVWLDNYDIPDDFVDVRLIIDTAVDTIAVFANGTHKGTHFYEVGYNDPNAAAWIYTSGASGEFDHVSIRVGGTGS